jgi:hypothetical protein
MPGADRAEYGRTAEPPDLLCGSASAAFAARRISDDFAF